MLMGCQLYFTTVKTYDLSFVFIIHTRQFLLQYFLFAIKTAGVVDVRKYHLLDLDKISTIVFKKLFAPAIKHIKNLLVTAIKQSRTGPL